MFIFGIVYEKFICYDTKDSFEEVYKSVYLGVETFLVKFFFKAVVH